MPISTMLTGKLISIGTSFFVVLGSGHYNLNQNVQRQDIAVPATTQITSAIPVESVPRSTTTSTRTAVSTTPPVTESELADALSGVKGEIVNCRFRISLYGLLPMISCEACRLF